MTRRISASQLRSKFRQAAQKRKQAINRYNQAVRRYNQQVRAHNSRVRAQRRRIKSELARLSRQSTTTRYVVYRTSVYRMHKAYARLEQRTGSLHLGSDYEQAIALSGRETANSLEVMNSLLGSEPDSPKEGVADLQSVKLTNELRNISQDLNDRWTGAVFSLSPRNPDAARHFCTSAREIITQILEITAPDQDVTNIFPECERTDQGKPTRRTKIKFILHRKKMTNGALEDFVEQDIDNILQLFRVFNEGTHGSAGKFDLHQLASIKKRVEDGIAFLSQLVN